MIDSRVLALAGLAGTLLTASLAAVGQVDPDPHLNHAALTVSDFAVNDRGGVTDTAMVVFGGSAFALLWALRPGWWPRIMLGLFGVAMIVAAVAPTDLGPLTATGYLHRYASMAAFVALPLGAMLLRPVSRAVRTTVLATSVFAALMLASATFGDRLWIGVAERGLLVAEVALLGLLCFKGWRQLSQPDSLIRSGTVEQQNHRSPDNRASLTLIGPAQRSPAAEALAPR